MKLEWIDILKLTVPFVTAILMVWIKSWIETWLTRKNKQHALSRLINDGLQDSLPTVEALSHIAESACKGNLRLVSIEISSLTSRFACDLADLDAKQAYCYADLASSQELVNKGLSRLSSFILSRVTATTMEVASQLDRAIHAQARITATDFITFCKSSLMVIKAIPEKYRYGDAQTLQNMEYLVTIAENHTKKWPDMVPPSTDYP